MTEEWKDIPGYEGLYRISNKANVSSWINGEWLQRRISPNNLLVFIHNNRKVTLNVKKLFAQLWGYPCPTTAVECTDYRYCHRCGFNPIEAERRRNLIDASDFMLDPATGLYRWKLVRDDA